jgi:hypothetical protein
MAGLFLPTLTSRAQESPAAASTAQPAGPVPRILIAPGPVPVDQPLEVVVELTGVPLQQIGPFPNLPGFKKTTRDRQTTTRSIGGVSTSTLRVTQRYLAFGEGDKVLPAFTIQVNGQPVRYAGGTVRISAATPAVPPTGTSGGGIVAYVDADDLFGKPKPTEYRDIPDQARLYLTVSAAPRGVWVGEGVRVRLFLTIAPEDQAVLNFANDFGRQIEQLRRAVKPPDVWEETPPAYPMAPDTVLDADQKPLLRFQLHDAVYYPLTAARPLRFPSVSLRLVKYRLAKKPVEGAENRLATDRILSTQPLEVAVRPLPPHALAGSVPVGELRWREFLSRDPARVNQPAKYWVEIEGIGNLAPVRFPEPLTTDGTGIAAYRPRVTTLPVWPPAGPGAIGGRKRFEWEFVADRAGTYRLDSLLQLVYFDPRRGLYDTLRSRLRWRVLGRPRPGADSLQSAAPWAADAFYQRIDREPLDAPAPPDPADLRRSANFALAVLALVALGLWWTGRRPS